MPIEFNPYGLAYLVFRHIRVILACLFVGVGATAAVVLLSPQKFDATESLVVNFSIAPNATAPGLRGGNDGGTSSDHQQVIASYVQILQSHILAEQVVAEVGATTLYPTHGRRAPASAQVNAAINKDPGAIDAVAFRLQRDIKVIPDPASNILQIHVANGTPSVALVALKVLVRRFLDEQSQLGRDSHLPFLQQQAENYRQQVATAQGAIDTFQKTHGVSAIDEERGYLFQQRATLEQSLKSADVRLHEDQSKLAAQRVNLAATPPVNRLASEDLQLMEGKVQLETLQAQRRSMTGIFKPESEKMRALDAQIAKLQGIAPSDGTINRTETNSVYASLQSAANETQADLKAVTNSRNLLAKQLADLEAKIANRSSLQGEYDELVRQYQLADQNYRQYLQAVQEAQISNDLSRQKISTVDVMDPAHALPGPVAPNKPLIMIGGAVSSLILALAVAYCLEIFDERLNSPRQIELLLGTPVLGSLENYPLRRLPMKRIGSNVVPLQMALLVVMVTACAVTAGRASAQQTPSSLGPMVPMISPKGCPAGYGTYRPVGGPISHQIICVPQAGQNRFAGQVDYQTIPLPTAECKVKEGAYACGVGASQCCAADRDNPCFPGAYACTAGVASAGQIRHSCCFSH